MLSRLNVYVSCKNIQKRLFAVTSSLRRMKDGYILLNSVPTHIISFGHWIEEKFDDKTKDIIVIVSGNPGLPGFYTTFGSTLFAELNKQIPIWIIGQAGM